ncbi:MAG: flagellar motor protein MotD [Gallionella sp.]|nr:flagellar motor protein MotD [Gallionella sp.]MDD4945749.1 flagellar motor protein MotD [Gallionella sp.]MDD5612038.1 flagellar motor protein MotD [Gallionella sp.]
MAHRKKRAEHDNHERWLISYADFITLLFAFFVVMYSISSVNEGKYQTFSKSLNVAFDNKSHGAPVTVGIVTSQQDQKLKLLVDEKTMAQVEQQRKIQLQMAAVNANLRQVMAPLISQGQVAISQNRRGVVVDISASMLFREGESTVQPAALDTLRQTAVVLESVDQAIEVEGHTDDVPIKNVHFPSNWELSAGRASSVVRMLVNYGVPETRLSAVGMAANHPVAPNDTPANRARNRRVTITILSPEFDRMNQSDAVQPVEKQVKTGTDGSSGR